MKHNVILSLLLLFAISCNQNQDTISTQNSIKIDIGKAKKEIPLNGIFIGHELVDLSLKNGDLIKSISDVKFFSEKFFLADNLASSIYIFDSQGNHLTTIKNKGDGPEEYKSLSFFDINRKYNTIDIMDIRGSKIIRYDFEGNFKYTLPARVVCRDFAVDLEGNYLFLCPDEPVNPEGNLHFKQGVIKYNFEEGFSSVLQFGDESYMPIITGKSFFYTPEGVGLLTTYSDTLYIFNKNSTVEKTILDYGKRINEAALKNMNFNVMEADFPFLKFFPAHFNGFYTYSTTYKGNPYNVLFNAASKEVEVFTYPSPNDLGLIIPFRGYGIGDRYAIPIDSEIIMQLKSFYNNERDQSGIDMLESRITNNNGNPILWIYRTN